MGFAQIIISGLKLRDLSSFNLVPFATTAGVNSPSPQGTTVREAHVSYGETISWRAWEAIGPG
jgi:hypothetical protein